MKIGIGIPSPERIHPDFALHSLPKIIQYSKRIPDCEIYIRYEQGVRTDRNRNIILTDFIDEGVDYVLWLDADMVYPADIIERYLELNKHQDFSVIGCLYFKRTPPYTPIGYIDSNEPQKPFRPLMPQLIKKGTIYEVTGLGYGGMMVSMKVYEKLGDNKWVNYGDNFNNPHATSGNLTHDLVFCQTVKKAGFKIWLHGSIRPGHIGEKLITEADFFDNFPPKLLPGLKVKVGMPTIDMELGVKAAEIMRRRSGYPVDVEVLFDDKRQGFTKTINQAFRRAVESGYHFFIYTAQDALVGAYWLQYALVEQFKTQAGLVALNDGKWDGTLASFGMVDCSWAKKNYNGDLFCLKYNAHYTDTELTQIAKHQGMFAYAPKSIMMEVDYNKPLGKGKINLDDKKLYNKRIKKLVSEELAQEFS